MITKYYHTLVHLKPIQIRYQMWYRIRRYLRRIINFKYPLSLPKEGFPIKLKTYIPAFPSFSDDQFTFLNQSKSFTGNDIDWNYHVYGKLWTYNLNYFDFLLQPDINPEVGERLLNDFLSKINNKSTALDPYPIALRGMNWIKFFSRHSFSNFQIFKFSNSLYAQYQVLLDNKEYHLLGNHLLEDGFSLLFGAYYFQDIELYDEAKKILIPQLAEQILPDGAHFELSPMYHCTMLFRMLDSYNLVSSNTIFNNELSTLFKEKCELMLAWINIVSFRNGNIPLMNDAAFNIAFSPKQLNEYAYNLGLKIDKAITLNESGYRKFINDKFELLTDVGNPGPDYQMGHAHADTFTFELYINGRPVIVDTGTSTYEINDTRFYERSTSAHNTVVVNNLNSSQVWGGHRVAKRAKVKMIKDATDLISASHNGYQDLDQIHTRTFINSGNSIKLIDEITHRGVSYLHFEPGEELKIIDHEVIGKDYAVSFIGAESIESFNTEYSPEFNKKIECKALRITFNKKLETLFK